MDALDIRVGGVVQGVGFRPFLFRLARRCGLAGWVLNDDDGVRIHVEGTAAALDGFVRELHANPPAASSIARVAVAPGASLGCRDFEIRASEAGGAATTRISPDLPVCDACLSEMADPGDRRYGYPYINCTDCGPRYSIIRGLPYDRRKTTLADWPLCRACAREFEDPLDRRFHAQPVACWQCGPAYALETPAGGPTPPTSPGRGAAILDAARLLADGRIVAVKGIGGYHLACDAANAGAVAALRERKYREEQPFAVMVRDLAAARALIDLDDGARALLESPARPIVLAPSRARLAGVAPDNQDLGVMLPYAPLHHLLFARGAPACLIMTSGNRSSEPIAFHDRDARQRLGGLSDAVLVGERPIARRVEDSVVRAGPAGPIVLRRARGLAPSVVATMPPSRPVLALGGDLKNAVTLVVDGQACVGPHAGDLAHAASRQAFEETVDDLLAIYGLTLRDVLVAHDAHPGYATTAFASSMGAIRGAIAVQHHRAHVASVLAERGAWDQRVLGIALDGTGFGDDGSIWGGEFFTGSVREGFTRVAHLEPAVLPGGDAAARHPVQAAAGFLTRLTDLPDLPDLSAPPFSLPPRYRQAQTIAAAGVRTFPTTSAGRLFDTVAALLGFTRSMTFEGQAAIWLEHLARGEPPCALPPMIFTGTTLDWRPTVAALIRARLDGAPAASLAHGFHVALAAGLAAAATALAPREQVGIVVLSGGVFQNVLLLRAVFERLSGAGLAVWMNHAVPANDGGLSLGQAAIAIVEGAEPG